MSRELWGTFSVRDHLAEHAFVADVLLYDRLLIPTKPENADPKDWPEMWAPERQKRVLGLLGDLAFAIPWSDYRHEAWERTYEAEKKRNRTTRRELVQNAALDILDAKKEVAQAQRDEEAAYYATRRVLADAVHSPTGDRLFQRLLATEKARPGSEVEAVAAYTSFDAFSAEVPVETKEGEKEQPENTSKEPMIAPTAIFGWDFFLPDSDERGEDADLRLLERAVKLANDPGFIESRGRLYDWIGDTSKGISQGVLSREEARRLMEARIAEYQEFMKAQGWRRWVKRAVKIANAFTGGLGVVHPIAGAITGGFLGCADVAADEWLKDPQISERAKVAAVFHDARRKFGWKPLDKA